jgi:nucleoside-diphosphate-sugar epimerase
VIPLHRDHGVITMAAGKNDVIKLLPPLTLSEAEAQSFLAALDAVLADCEGSGSKNWSLVRDIAKATLLRRGRTEPPAGDAAPPGPAADAAPPRPAADAAPDVAPQAPTETTPARGKRLDPSRQDVCLITGASGFIGGRLAQRLAEHGRAVRCLVRASSDTRALERLDVEIAVGDLHDAPSLARAVAGCRHVLHCGALVSDWATKQEIADTNVAGTRNLLHACAAASVERFVHFSSTDVYGHPRADRAVDESYAARRFANWYAQTKLEAEAEVRRAASEHSLDVVILRPATVYGPGSTDVIGEIARAIRARSMLLVGGGRAVAGLCYVDNLLDAALLALEDDRARGLAFNVSDGLPVTWRELTDDLAEGLGCAPVRWSVPYWLASGIGYSLENGYRLLRRTTGLRAAPLLSRQAVQVLGRSQDFSNRQAREVLGWEPRVDYAAGLRATVDWLRDEHLQPA